MSCRYLPNQTSDTPIYISTVEVMLSSAKVVPSPVSRAALYGASFQRMPPEEIISDSAWYFPTHSSSTGTLPISDILPSPCLSSEVHSSRLDIVLAHSNKGNGLGKDNSCVNSSSIKSACPTLFRDTQCKGYNSIEARSLLASCSGASDWKGNDWDACHSSAVSFHSAASRALPCWTSRLDVSLCAIPDASSSQNKNLYQVLAPCNSRSTEQHYNQCNSQFSDLHASVKLYISTCSIAIKPISAAYSSLLLPHLKKISTTSPGLTAGPQMSHQVIPSGNSVDHQVKQLHVTNPTKCPILPQQTVFKEIWLTPSTLAKADSLLGKRTVANSQLDPDLVVFQNHHSTGKEFGKTSNAGIIPAHHKISKITLILATPWTSFPIKVVREFRKQPVPSVLIKASGSDMGGSMLQPDCTGSSISLSINPICCPEFQPSQESKPFQDPDASGNADRAAFLTHRQASSRAPGENTWCPSISVKIASFGTGRKVVKISIPF
ncbi:uncharacterized protein PHA67_008307 [Liasis olivaceus]